MESKPVEKESLSEASVSDSDIKLHFIDVLEGVAALIQVQHQGITLSIA
jgi:hypothetical protein